MTTSITLENIHLTFQTLDQPVLSNINYDIVPGDFVILLGSNGSGKSSLLKLLDKRYRPTQGKLYLNDKSIEHHSPKQFSRDVITLTQNPYDSLFSSLTLLENYLLVKQRNEPRLFSLSEKQEREFFSNHLLKFNKNLAMKLDNTVEALSGGEKQALALALSVIYPPRLLLLDEHTSALDPKTADTLMQITQQVVSEHHITCILTTHDLDIAERYGNRILALRHGKIFKMIDAAEKAILKQNHLLEKCY